MAKSKSGGITAAITFAKSFRSLNSQEIARETAQPFKLQVSGSDENRAALTARLACEASGRLPSPNTPDFSGLILDPAAGSGGDSGAIHLDADKLAGDEGVLAVALAQIIVDNPGLRLAIAARLPAFRPAVVAALVNEASWNNARIAIISAVPGVIPFTEILFPAAAIGDMVILTRNQAVLLLRIAAAYGLPVHLRDRSKELLPVVGSAFIWRSVARELVGIVPGGIGLVFKGAIAYAGTYTVGRAAAIYYSTGHTLNKSRLSRLYRDAFRSATGQVRKMLRRRSGGKVEIVAEEEVIFEHQEEEQIRD